MSEPYHAIQTVGAVDEYHWRISRGSNLLTHEEVSQLLNQQAETIEVLREWIRNTPINDDFEKIDEFERKLIRLQSEGCCVGMDTRVELARRRIAALEGK